MGRPPKDLDKQKLEMLMRLKPTLEDTAAFFDVSASHIEKFVKRHYKESFSEFRDKRMVHTRFNLIRKAIQKAESGDNVMLIFCLKNLCGWKEKQPGEEDHTVKHEGKITVSKLDLDERVKQIKGES